MTIFFIFLGIGILFFILFYFSYIISLVIAGIVPLATTQSAVRIIADIIQAEKTAHTIYDVGCGYGECSRALQKRLPNVCIYAIDNSTLRIFYAKIFSFLQRRKVFFQSGDLFQMPLADADVVYCYLPWSLMPRLEEKLLKELKPGACVITNTTRFPQWTHEQTHQTHAGNEYFEMLYVYRKK